jgi:hypothetical protein
MVYPGGGIPFFVKAYSGGSGVEPNQIDFVCIAVGFTMLLKPPQILFPDAFLKRPSREFVLNFVRQI